LIVIFEHDFSFIKPQVGWKSHDADAELFTPMFRFGYHEGMHKKHHGKTKDKWEKFVTYHQDG
jgi:hypothetical protein